MKRLITLVTVVAALLVAPAAFAANATGDGYGGSGNQIVTTHSGSLPFTGLDIALLAAGGILLLGIGVAVRRVSRSVA